MSPKQLHPLTAEDTMLQLTLRRVQHFDHPPLIIANSSHVEEIARQVPAPARIVGEPVARNTAPAVAVAALMSSDDDVLLVMPADHHIADEQAFSAAVGEAEIGAHAGYLVTFGIVPDRPETGYGYIVGGEAGPVGRRIARFEEKPDPQRAQQLIDGGALWNGGLFAFMASVVKDELRRYAPAVLPIASLALESARVEDRVVFLGDDFAEAPSVSIDVAVMERTDHGLVVPLQAGWSDAGSWESLYELGPVDQDGNVLIGDVITEGVGNSYLRSEGPLVAVLGLEDVIVVATPDAVLVTARQRAQDVKSIVERLTGRPEVDTPPAHPTRR